MRYGVMFPGDEFAFDTDDIDAWADAVAAAGFDHVVFGDHVLGADPTIAPSGWDRYWPAPAGSVPAYTNANVFREPLVLFGYLAARTRLELVSGVLVLPQRQAVLFAKQAAEADLLSRGRLRLTVAVGWNPLEYEALGVAFARRGRILEEQIALVRRLWTEPVVSFEGEFVRVQGCGLGALPVQRPIPLWLGGDSPAALRRVGQIGDGWFVPGRVSPDADGAAALAAVRAAAEDTERDSDIGVEAKVVASGRTDHELRDVVNAWSQVGATHTCIDTRYGGLQTMDEHIAEVQRASAVLL